MLSVTHPVASSSPSLPARNDRSDGGTASRLSSCAALVTSASTTVQGPPRGDDCSTDAREVAGADSAVGGVGASGSSVGETTAEGLTTAEGFATGVGEEAGRPVTGSWPAHPATAPSVRRMAAHIS